MGRGRYNGYRGRLGLRDVLKITVVLLAVLGVLAAAALMFAQRYIIYTDEGVRLELPFFSRESSPPADISVEVDVVQPKSSESTASGT